MIRKLINFIEHNKTHLNSGSYISSDLIYNFIIEELEEYSSNMINDKKIKINFKNYKE